MSDETRYPELTRCQKAATAIDDFDTAHESKRLALFGVGYALEHGGWDAVKFREWAPISGEGLRADIDPVSKNDLAAESIETLVLTRARLVEEWREAYGKVPAIIRAAASSPGQL
jgi:hypothetical protein